ncbi:hypothetical protein AB840_04835 [Megasphaera cerevisiae DSM 20462]|jgi:transcriptional regulator with XRE-family HTH domain|uniref:HTH cro/C1-type domain-containing protein n=1 Tax=Megasphaera cerevisiae DSM 20462 TaxID=1122219 RepID=A0A0J6WXY7_9FIRM|nr:helix-turn-helix transcriptional regulator [Megasphaera cerevisiae]KMO87088.1 hypothetical protein AB840_04835 [Megasphaera cerevisiae DSM 20462]OKY53481.1 hypothetical protein BSR42_07250 [Megasphaera cerevisiae]SJZ78491.1 Predicted transcriptional regulator with C-terminal CBS domains [Megasphaera cerevisiae DSM 20462]
MELYERIKKRREELDLSQDELAQKLGYKSRSTIAKIEKGENDITQSKIAAFAQALQTTPSTLMGWDNTEAIQLNKKNERDIQKRLNAILSDMDSDGMAMFNGDEEMDDETKELLKASIENSIRMAKIRAKEKFTPKKHKK